MNGITHKIAGVCIGTVATGVLIEPTPISCGLVIAGSVIGSLFPDIDEPNSIAGSKARLASKIIKHTTGHRGFFHTPLNLIISSALLFLFHLKVAGTIFANFDYNDIPWALFLFIGYVAGYASHLILDFITPTGIMIFYPFTKKKFHVFGFKGAFGNVICSLICIGLTVFYFLSKYKII